MKVVLIVYLVLLGSGGLFACVKAIRYWRARADNSSKLAALMLAKTVLDLASFGLIVWLWYGEVASEWTIFIAVLPVVGILTGAITLAENRLTTGKYITLPTWN